MANFINANWCGALAGLFIVYVLRVHDVRAGWSPAGFLPVIVNRRRGTLVVRVVSRRVPAADPAKKKTQKLKHYV